MLVAELSQAHNWNLKHPWGKLPFDPMLLLRLEELSSPGVYYNWFLGIIVKCKTLLACGWFVGLFVLLLLIYQVLRKGGSCRPVLGAVHLCPFAPWAFAWNALSPFKHHVFRKAFRNCVRPQRCISFLTCSSLLPITLYILYLIILFIVHFFICMCLGSATRLQLGSKQIRICWLY